MIGGAAGIGGGGGAKWRDDLDGAEVVVGIDPGTRAPRFQLIEPQNKNSGNLLDCRSFKVAHP
jgi:hypothetical protein